MGLYAYQGEMGSPQLSPSSGYLKFRASAQLVLEERAGGLSVCEQLAERMVLAQFSFWYSWSVNPKAEPWSLFQQ